jgi:hypothetical protein
MPRRLTLRQQDFARALAVTDLPTVAVFRAIYPPQRGPRQPQTELTKSYRLSKDPRVRELVQNIIATEPERRKLEAMITLHRVEKGELPRERAIFAKAELHRADKELRKQLREQEERVRRPQQAAWKLFWQLQQAIVKSRKLSPEQRTALIFRTYAPQEPVLSEEVLAEEARSQPLTETACGQELREFVRLQQEERWAELPQEPEPQLEQQLPQMPSGSGHWENQRIPGRFGKGAVRRVWMPDNPEENDHG